MRVGSQPPVATVRPSGLNATEVIVSVWPRSTSRRRGRAGSVTSHSTAVVSPVVASVSPSGLNAVEVTT